MKNQDDFSGKMNLRKTSTFPQRSKTCINTGFSRCKGHEKSVHRNLNKNKERTKRHED